jgi:ribosomal protein S18 acetylase RimI-like enzyme
MIRPAQKSDVDAVVPLIVSALAPGSFQLTDSGDESEAYPVVSAFFLQEVNRHSYRNTIVYEVAGVVAAAVVCYDGAHEAALAQPILTFIRNYYEDETLPPHYETQPGELYIDTLAVDPAFRKRGIARLLLDAVCAQARSMGLPCVGLLVEDVNVGAKALYANYGFQVTGFKNLWEHQYEHMQYVLD